VDMVVCALHPRTAYKYGRRGERYIHIEVGHVGQNLSLQAVTMGLATVMVGAFEDEEVEKVLKLENQIKPLYIIPIGKPV
jgi:SagB-type dehydrogenase family enzyme